jgi:hypothetical protein
MQIFEIPLSGTPQRFPIPLAGVTYVMLFQFRVFGPWNSGQGTWHLDIFDTDSNPLACGIPLITGANLLQQFDYLNFGGELWVVTEGSDDPPTYDGLGTSSHLYFIMLTDDERQTRAARMAPAPD